MEKRNSTTNRRTFLSISGSIIACSGIVSGQQDNSEHPLSDDPDIPGGKDVESTREQRLRFLEEEYGKREAEIIQATAVGYRRKVDRGVLSPDEAFRKASDDLIHHPRTPRVTADIRERREFLDRTQVEDDLTDDDSGIQAVGDRRTVEVTRGQQGRETWGVGAADTEINVTARRMHANARVSSVGGASSFTRLFGRITPDSSIGGAVRMTVRYFRQGGVLGGNAQVYYFVRESARPSTTAVFFPVESPGFVKGSVTRSVQFVMPEGIQHDVGIQLETSAETIGGVYVYADYFTTVIDLSRRQLAFESSIQIEALD